MRENPLGGKQVMPIQRYKPEQIVTMLRQIEVGIANGKNHPTSLQGSRHHGADVLPLAERIRGMKMDQAKRLKELERYTV